MSDARVLTCVYCGHEYPQDSPSWGHGVLTTHVRACEAHPMRKVVEDRDRLRAALAGVLGVDGREALGEMRKVVAVLPGDEDTRRVSICAIDVLLATLPEVPS